MTAPAPAAERPTEPVLLAGGVAWARRWARDHDVHRWHLIKHDEHLRGRRGGTLVVQEDWPLTEQLCDVARARDMTVVLEVR